MALRRSGVRIPMAPRPRLPKTKKRALASHPPLRHFVCPWSPRRTSALSLLVPWPLSLLSLRLSTHFSTLISPAGEPAMRLSLRSSLFASGPSAVHSARLPLSNLPTFPLPRLSSTSSSIGQSSLPKGTCDGVRKVLIKAPPPPQCK